MTLYYVKQDDTVWCCEDDCGPYYEEHKESFINCEHNIPENEMTADHLHWCNGGGPVIKWRKAKNVEIVAFESGTKDGFGQGWDEGIKWHKDRETK